jgi:hypothetical protein
MLVGLRAAVTSTDSTSPRDEFGNCIGGDANGMLKAEEPVR